MYSYEQELWNQGYTHIAGIDEAGRGPLAGPVVAAAVILPRHIIIDGINDSKALSAKKREHVYREIMVSAHVGVGIIHHTVIDTVNIFNASKIAMIAAMQDLIPKPDFLLIDGASMRLDISIPHQAINKGDALSASIAAASIIAKVTRDKIMRMYHEQFPLFNFAQHKGYPTREHVELLAEHGPSTIHRKTFSPVKKYIS